MKCIVFYIFLLMLCTNLFGQNISISGFVTDENGEPIEFFHGILLSPDDSSMLYGGAFIDGEFEFDYINEQDYLLKLSSVGYTTKYILCQTAENQNLNLGTIQLSSIVLNEISVIAKRPVIIRRNGNIVVNVKSSSLRDAGSSMDVLRKSPGVIVDKQNNIQVIGKGSTLIFINDKEVYSQSELEVLQSNDIESIEIDRNPSAEYSASGHAVIRIKTKKITNDKLNILFINNAYIANNFSNSSGIKINSKINKTTNYFSYTYTSWNTTEYEKTKELITLPGETFENNTETTNNNKSKKHDVFWGANYEINKKNTLGFQLMTSLVNNSGNTLTNEVIITQTELKRIININGNDNNKFYDFNFNYKLKPDTSSSFLVMMDYAKKATINDDNVKERNLPFNVISITDVKNKSYYNVLTGRADYKFLSLKNIDTKIGIKYSGVVNNSIINTVNQDFGIAEQIGSDIYDQIIASYVSTKKKVTNFTYKAGIRYENTNSHINFLTSVDKNIDTSYYNFFPSLMLNYDNYDNFILTLSYSKRISRPGFSELNPNKTYFDSLSYYIGNPFLRPTYSKNFEIAFNILKDFDLSINYTIEKDKRFQVGVNDDNNAHIIKYTIVNINNSQSFSASLNYAHSGDWYTIYSNISFIKPYAKLPYLNADRIINEPIWFFYMSNEFNIFKDIILYIDFEFESNGVYDLTYYKYAYNFSGGVYKKMFNNQLFVSVSFNDLLNTYNTSMIDKFGYIDTSADFDADTQWIKFSIKFYFNDFESLFEKKSSNKNVLKRL